MSVTVMMNAGNECNNQMISAPFQVETVSVLLHMNPDI